MHKFSIKNVDEKMFIYQDSELRTNSDFTINVVLIRIFMFMKNLSWVIIIYNTGKSYRISYGHY